MQLRPWENADLDRLVGWLADERNLALWSGPTFTWPVTAQDLLDRVGADGAAAWLRTAVDDSGTMIGLARVSPEPPTAGRYGWVILDPVLRGRGLGAELVHLSVAGAFAETGLERLNLWVFRHNVGARRLYQREGFTPTGQHVDLAVAGEGWRAVELTLLRPGLVVPDPVFDDPRLAALYDPLDPDRSDLEVYRTMAQEFAARSVLDIGCGTGTFALMLSVDGVSVTGVEPAGASLAIARAKPGADRVRWVHGTAADALPAQVDLVTMTANVAQVFVSDAAWLEVMRAAFEALRPGGRLVFETRVPQRRAWDDWTRAKSLWQGEIAGVGPLTTFDEVVDEFEQWVTFRWVIDFDADKSRLTSLSTLRFRPRAEIEATLAAAGFVVDEVRDAPDRPGREWVFVASKPPS